VAFHSERDLRGGLLFADGRIKGPGSLNGGGGVNHIFQSLFFRNGSVLGKSHNFSSIRSGCKAKHTSYHSRHRVQEQLII